MTKPKQKHKKLTPPPKRAREAKPMFTALGMEFTPAMLAVAFSMLLALVVGGVLLFTVTPAAGLFSSAPKVVAIDVYTAVNGMGYAKPGELLLSKDTTPMKIPGPSQILVSRENAAGKHLLVKVNVTDKELDTAFPGSGTQIRVSTMQFELRAGGQRYEPVFILEDDGDSFHLGFMPPKSETREYNLRDYLGPGKEGRNNWTHPGELKETADQLVFNGQNGMQVTISTGADRQDGKEGSSRLGALTGTDAGNVLESSGLVGAPGGFVKVSWNGGCTGHMVGLDLERPNDISRSWDVWCIFPRPEGAREAELVVLGKPRKIKLP